MRLSFLFTISSLLTACPPWPPPGGWDCETSAEQCSTSAASSGDPSSGGQPTTTDGPSPATATTFDTTGAPTAPDETTATAPQDLPADLPQILDYELVPPEVTQNGFLALDVWTAHANILTLAIDDDPPFAMAEAGPDAFHHDLEIFSGLLNGDHTLTLTPWQGALAGEAVEVHFNVDLPEPGGPGLFETGDIFGPGHIVATAVDLDGFILFYGTHFVGNESRCFLWRRAANGTWTDQDLKKNLLGDEHCSALDMKVDPDTGAINLLAYRKFNNQVRWWAGEISWATQAVTNLGMGTLGDNALKLALRPGARSVCGSRPSTLDAMATLLRDNQLPETLIFEAPTTGPTKLAEVARDCVFAGDTLVLVGGAFGSHQMEDPDRELRFIAEYDTVMGTTTWTVGGPGPGTQSRATTVALDDEGRYLIGGTTCSDICKRDAEVRIHLPGGELVDQIPLGPLASELAGPNDIAWSPAELILVALADDSGPTPRFKVVAIVPGTEKPAWVYLPADMNGLQVALAVIAGPTGMVYAAGIGADNFPAIAFIPA